MTNEIYMRLYTKTYKSTRVQSITKFFLLRKLKKSGFRGPILANSYRSYALSHFTYSASVLTSVSEKAKYEINNFHSRILKILKLTPEEAEYKYKITNIFVLIDTACLNFSVDMTINRNNKQL